MLIKKSFNTRVVRAVLLGFAILVAIPFANADESTTVFPRDTTVPYGRSYSEWAAAWWQWALSIPVSEHPLFDNGPCEVGQSGPVFFLGGKFCSTTGADCTPGIATRACTVPAGKALFFPIANVEDSVLEGPRELLTDMRQFVEEVIDAAENLEVTIDGRRIPNLEQNFRVQSPAFGFTLPSDNLFNAIGSGPFEAGTYFPAVDDGIYLMLKPLPVGSHTIHFAASFPEFGFNIDVTYNITVPAG